MEFIDAVSFFYKEEKRFNKIEIHIVNGCKINYLSAYLDEKSYCPEISLIEKEGSTFINLNINPLKKEQYSLKNFTENHLKDIIDGRITQPLTRELFNSKINERRDSLVNILNTKNLECIKEYNRTLYKKDNKELFIINENLPFSTYKDVSSFSYRDDKGLMKSTYFTEVEDYESLVNSVLGN